MREIKFRAWDSDNNSMIYSNQDRIDTADYWWEISPLKVGCITGESGGSQFEPPEPIVTYYEDIMQFTGLYDKSEKEVYEGDILDNNLYVGWNQLHCAWALFDNKGLCKELLADEYDSHGDSLTPWHIDIEIIGNIYENPELIK